jgi:hypothetical protein
VEVVHRIAWLARAGSCALFLLAAPLYPATAATEIGKATIVVSNVTGTVDNVTKRVVINDNVEQNEVIATSPDGATEIHFADGTVIKVGPNSKVVLDKFIYDPNPSKGALVVSLSAGVMRFTTGNMPHENYKITTPDGTLGVRGTDLTIVVFSGGTVVQVITGVVVGYTSTGAEKVFANGQYFTILGGNITQSTSSQRDQSNSQSNQLNVIFVTADTTSGAPPNTLVITPPPVDIPPQNPNTYSNTDTTPSTPDDHHHHHHEWHFARDHHFDRHDHRFGRDRDRHHDHRFAWDRWDRFDHHHHFDHFSRFDRFDRFDRHRWEHHDRHWHGGDEG